MLLGILHSIEQWLEDISQQRAKVRYLPSLSIDVVEPKVEKNNTTENRMNGRADWIVPQKALRQTMPKGRQSQASVRT